MDQDRTHTATVAGPVAGGKGWPFASPTYDVAALGCAMEEFFIEGVACSYRPVAGSEVGRDGRWQTEIGATAAYRTLGGIRLPEMEAPTARNSGTNALNPLAALAGESVPIEPAQLAELYADEEMFLKAWGTAIDSLVADELVLPDAVDAVRARGRDLAQRRLTRLPRKAH